MDFTNYKNYIKGKFNPTLSKTESTELSPRLQKKCLHHFSQIPARLLLSHMGPYLKHDIDKLERVQRQAARFITGDYKTQEEGCVTRMLETLELSSLEQRRRLVFMLKVVEGLVPAIPPDAGNLRNLKYRSNLRNTQIISLKT